MKLMLFIAGQEVFRPLAGFLEYLPPLEFPPALSKYPTKQFLASYGHFDITELLSRRLVSFSEHQNILKKLELAMETGGDSDSYCPGKMIVGFDIVGDEMWLPYVPFVCPEFVKFAKALPGFGCRIHFGEVSVPSTPDKLTHVAHENHMRLGLEACVFLRENSIPLRIGHGVAIAHELTRPQDGSEAHARIKDLIDKLTKKEKNAVIIEINPTSNFQLLLNAQGEVGQSEEKQHALTTLKHKFDHTISTDDDGIIWPIVAWVSPETRAAAAKLKSDQALDGRLVSVAAETLKLRRMLATFQKSLSLQKIREAGKNHRFRPAQPN
jgi:hypothetical protein